MANIEDYPTVTTMGVAYDPKAPATWLLHPPTWIASSSTFTDVSVSGNLTVAGLTSPSNLVVRNIGYGGSLSPGGVSGALTVDWNNGSFISMTLQGNVTLSIINWPSNMDGELNLLIAQGGAFTLTWPAAIKWPGGVKPVITATPGRTDVFRLLALPGGAVVLGCVLAQNVF